MAFLGAFEAVFFLWLVLGIRRRDGKSTAPNAWRSAIARTDGSFLVAWSSPCPLRRRLVHAGVGRAR